MANRDHELQSSHKSSNATAKTEPVTLVPLRHELWEDPTSPLFTDFPAGTVNQLYRPIADQLTIRSSVAI